MLTIRSRLDAGRNHVLRTQYCSCGSPPRSSGIVTLTSQPLLANVLSMNLLRRVGGHRKCRNGSHEHASGNSRPVGASARLFCDQPGDDGLAVLVIDSLRGVSLRPDVGEPKANAELNAELFADM